MNSLPTALQPYSLRLACHHAVGTTNTETLIHNFDYLLAVFLNNPVNSRAFGAYPDAFPAPCAFFFIDEYIDHNCNIPSTYINNQTK